LIEWYNKARANTNLQLYQSRDSRVSKATMAKDRLLDSLSSSTWGHIKQLLNHCCCCKLVMLRGNCNHVLSM